MKISFLDILFVLPLISVLLLVYGFDYYQWSFAIIPAGVLAAIYFVLAKDIQLWRKKRALQSIPDGLKHFLNQHFQFYGAMSSEEKSIYEKALIPLLFWEYRPSGFKDVDERSKISISAYAAFMNCFLTDPITQLHDINCVVLYRHQFPSPEFPFLHISEWNEEDDVFIFTEPYILKATTDPVHHFNPVIYEFAKICADKREHSIPKDFPFENVSGYSIDQISQYSGIPSDKLSRIAIIIHHTIIHPESVSRQQPDTYEAISALLEWPKEFASSFSTSLTKT